MNPMPRVLLVEDDPVSRAVLGAAVESCGLRVDTADCVQTALRMAAPARHALWLIDAHLPDGSGIELLTALRSNDAGVVAIAHTASLDPALHRRLRNAGFIDVLVKPLPADRIVDTLRLWLPALACTRMTSTHVNADANDGTPLWNDETALRALNGNRGHVDALRTLFLAELPDIAGRVAMGARTGDNQAFRAALHRLHASCGFVGAARLTMAVRALDAQCDDAAVHQFEAAARDTLASTRDAQPA